MNKAIALLLFCASYAWAGESALSGYNINIHVTRSRLVSEPRSIGPDQVLDVTINGMKYELDSASGPNALLALGDYKAKLVKDEHKSPYDTLQVYEILLPDGKTRKFEVVGQSE